MARMSQTTYNLSLSNAKMAYDVTSGEVSLTTDKKSTAVMSADDLRAIYNFVQRPLTRIRNSELAKGKGKKKKEAAPKVEPKKDKKAAPKKKAEVKKEASTKVAVVSKQAQAKQVNGEVTLGGATKTVKANAAKSNGNKVKEAVKETAVATA